MKNRTLPAILLIVVLFIVFGHTSSIFAQPRNTDFQIGKFKIYADPATILINGQRPAGGQWWRTLNFEGKVLSGSGYTFIAGKRLPVKFSNIQIHVSGSKLIADSGIVSGSGNEKLTYTLGAFNIGIQQPSVHITVFKAGADVNVSLPLNRTTFSSDQQNAANLTASSCAISPDGSIDGSEFYPAADLDLAVKDTPYQFKLLKDNNHQIKLSPIVSSSGNRAILSGSVGSNSIRNLFTFKCEIAQDGQNSIFTLHYITSATAPPEKRLEKYYSESPYDLTFKKGELTYKFGPDGKPAIAGDFTADLSLPQNVKDENGAGIVLEDIRLFMDKTNALSGTVPFKYRIKIGNNFTVEAAPESALVYLPWHQDTLDSIFPVAKDIKCSDLFSFLETTGSADTGNFRNHVDRRPGLTLLKGTLYFTSPQIDSSAAQAQVKNTVKTIFTGGLTVTPYGIAGEITSGGNTFVPYDKNIGECEKSIVPPRPTWEQVRTAPGPPSPITERFKLAELRILEMRVERMRFCPLQATEDPQRLINPDPDRTTGSVYQPLKINRSDATYREKIFRYVVHFPHPSYINLEFQDTSLDDAGRFHSALGPIAPYSWTFYDESTSTGSQSASQADIFSPHTQKPPAVDPREKDPSKQLKRDLLTGKVKGAQARPQPDTYILWAWHLPVSFVDRGVHLSYRQKMNKDIADVAVEMNTNHKAYGEILSNELWIRPLYSRNSAIKTGIRFSAKMTANGGFELTGWDNNPFFAKSYVRPTETISERSVGFDCKLDSNSIILPSTPQPKITWQGKLEFPFFGWQNVIFAVTDLEPALMSPSALKTDPNMTLRQKICFSGTTYQACSETDLLALEVGSLIYSQDTASFKGIVTNYQQTPQTGATDRISGSTIDISSFIRGTLTLKNVSPPRSFPIPIESQGHLQQGYLPSENYGNCQARPKWIIQEMADARDGTNLIDLVCYDSGAMSARGLGSCDSQFIMGTYQVKSCENSNFDVTTRQCLRDEIVTLSAPNAKYYPSLKKLELQNTNLALKSDDTKESHTTQIGIPGAALAFDANGKLTGAFGATLTTVAQSLPYEGEFRFMLDPRHSYYYVLGAGSFTYYLRFSGSTFVLHAPYKDLYENPFRSYLGVTDLLEDLRIRSLLGSVDEFTSAIGLPAYNTSSTSSNNACTIISGLFSSGNVSYSFGYGPLGLSVASGTGNFLFQYKLPDNQVKYGVGTFVSSLGISDLYALSLEAPSYVSTALVLPRGYPRSFSEFTEFFNKSDFMAGGKIAGNICGSILLGHCEAGISGEARYSSQTGLDLSASGVCAHCKGGDCCHCP